MLTFEGFMNFAKKPEKPECKDENDERPDNVRQKMLDLEEEGTKILDYLVKSEDDVETHIIYVEGTNGLEVVEITGNLISTRPMTTAEEEEYTDKGAI